MASSEVVLKTGIKFPPTTKHFPASIIAVTKSVTYKLFLNSYIYNANRTFLIKISNKIMM